MTIIETSNLNNYLRKTPHYQGNFQTQGINQKSKVATYLDSLYSYPPKLKSNGIHLISLLIKVITAKKQPKIAQTYRLLNLLKIGLLMIHPNNKSMKIIN